MADDLSPAADKGGRSAVPVKAPSLYPPCIHAANQLHPIAISQMKLDTHHRGKQTVIRVLTHPRRDAQLLYYQPFEEVVPTEQTFRLGRCYLIKEPFCTADYVGRKSLRVDHPSDFFLLPHDDELLPIKWRRNDPFVGRSSEVRMKGNECVGKKRWAEAEYLYTAAARTAATSEEAKLAYLNRSLANLRLGRPATALADAIKSYGTENSALTEKGLFREASALYDLGKYEQSLDRLQALKSAYPTNNLATPMIHRVQARLKEQQTGEYDFRHMYKQAEATPPLIDCATYTMPVKIQDSPGKGRGVFTTRKVLAGEMLICEKAFGYSYAGKDHPDSRNMTDMDVMVQIRTQIVQRLLHNFEETRLFGDLYHGDYNPAPVYEVDGKHVVDSALVTRVITLTNYLAARTSFSTYGKLLSGDVQGLESDSSTMGVWSFISYINHSCINNVYRSFIGDMQIVRATKDLEAGSELLASYIGSLPFESYGEVQQRLSHWGFTCECALCLDSKATSEKVLLKRKSLVRELGQSTGVGGQARDITDDQRTFDRLTQTWPASKEPGAVRPELSIPCQFMGNMLITMGKNSQAIDMALKGLEALGFVISACPRRGITELSKPELRIEQWGMPIHVFTVDAFRILHLAYKTIAPENTTVARSYMETAYSMFVGEKETFLDTFPDRA